MCAAWARHAMCESAFKKSGISVLLKYLSITHSNLAVLLLVFLPRFADLVLEGRLDCTTERGRAGEFEGFRR
jgi:hypothetical protein